MIAAFLKYPGSERVQSWNDQPKIHDLFYSWGNQFKQLLMMQSQPINITPRQTFWLHLAVLWNAADFFVDQYLKPTNLMWSWTQCPKMYLLLRKNWLWPEAKVVFNLLVSSRIRFNFGPKKNKIPINIGYIFLQRFFNLWKIMQHNFIAHSWWRLFPC